MLFILSLLSFESIGGRFAAFDFRFIRTSFGQTRTFLQLLHLHFHPFSSPVLSLPLHVSYVKQGLQLFDLIWIPYTKYHNYESRFTINRNTIWHHLLLHLLNEGMITWNQDGKTNISHSLNVVSIEAGSSFLFDWFSISIMVWVSHHHGASGREREERKEKKVSKGWGKIGDGRISPRNLWNEWLFLLSSFFSFMFISLVSFVSWTDLQHPFSFCPFGACPVLSVLSSSSRIIQWERWKEGMKERWGVRKERTGRRAMRNVLFQFTTTYKSFHLLATLHTVRKRYFECLLLSVAPIVPCILSLSLATTFYLVISCRSWSGLRFMDPDSRVILGRGVTLTWREKKQSNLLLLDTRSSLLIRSTLIIIILSLSSLFSPSFLCTRHNSKAREEKRKKTA